MPYNHDMQNTENAHTECIDTEDLTCTMHTSKISQNSFNVITLMQSVEYTQV